MDHATFTALRQTDGTAAGYQQKITQCEPLLAAAQAKLASLPAVRQQMLLTASAAELRGIDDEIAQAATDAQQLGELLTALRDAFAQATRDEHERNLEMRGDRLGTRTRAHVIRLNELFPDLARQMIELLDEGEAICLEDRHFNIAVAAESPELRAKAMAAKGPVPPHWRIGHHVSLPRLNCRPDQGFYWQSDGHNGWAVSDAQHAKFLEAQEQLRQSVIAAGRPTERMPPEQAPPSNATIVRQPKTPPPANTPFRAIPADAEEEPS